MHEKTPVLLAPPPTKKRKLDGLSNGATSHSPREGMQLDSPRDADESSGNAWGCVRAVDWEQLLAGRRRVLVQGIVAPDSLPPLPSAQESRKRWRASAAHYQLHRNRQQTEEEAGGRHEGGVGSGRRVGAGGGSGHKNSPHSSHHPLHAGSNRKNHHSKHHHAHHLDAGAGLDSPSAAKSAGSVLKGGRSVVTNSGQKVVIKFSATRPPPQTAARTPASPAHTPLSKYKNGGFKDGRDSGPNTPVLSAQKKHKSLLSLVTQSKISSPRMSPSANPSTPRGADWGIDDYVYGGPRTHTKIEIVKAKEIETDRKSVV